MRVGIKGGALDSGREPLLDPNVKDTQSPFLRALSLSWELVKYQSLGLHPRHTQPQDQILLSLIIYLGRYGRWLILFLNTLTLWDLFQ